MESELQLLGDKVTRLADAAARLAEENRELRRRLESAESEHAELERRVSQSRARVESALSRLPLLDATTETPTTQPVRSPT